MGVGGDCITRLLGVSGYCITGLLGVGGDCITRLLGVGVAHITGLWVPGTRWTGVTSYMFGGHSSPRSADTHEACRVVERERTVISSNGACLGPATCGYGGRHWPPYPPRTPGT